MKEPYIALLYATARWKSPLVRRWVNKFAASPYNPEDKFLHGLANSSVSID
jgi:hypothetical protein